jgi:hypothetical protein
MATYARVEATGKVEQINPQGIKIDGLRRNPSKRIAVDLSRFRIGDTVYVEGDETSDGARRWIAALDVADGHQRPAQPVYERDPDDLPDSPARPPAPDADKADRLACLNVAAGVLMPWWVKKGEDPDSALLIGFADQLLAYVQRRA